MNRTYWALIVLTLVVLDQFSKYLSVTYLPLQQEVPLVPFLSLYLTYNKGVAFSMLSFMNGWPLNVLTIVIIGFVLWLWSSVDKSRWLSHLGYALVIGGAIGNLIDRVRLGKVVDMILFHTQTWSFAIFNVADAFISVGAAAIVLDELLKWRTERANKLNEGNSNE